jgi:hypothetical protein
VDLSALPLPGTSLARRCFGYASTINIPDSPSNILLLSFGKIVSPRRKGEPDIPAPLSGNVEAMEQADDTIKASRKMA